MNNLIPPQEHLGNNPKHIDNNPEQLDNNSEHLGNNPEQFHSRKKSSWIRKCLAVIFVVTIIVGIYMFFHHKAVVKEQLEREYMAQIEAENRRYEAEWRALEHQREIEQQRLLEIQDSIRIANMPSYSLDDVREMVTARVPSYSWIYLWRLDNDNWIMKYMREYGGKEHWFMRRFNPTTGKFEKAIEYATVYYPNDDLDRTVYSRPQNVRCEFNENSSRGNLEYYEDGVYIGTYSNNEIRGLRCIRPTTVSPLAQQRKRRYRQSRPDWADEYDSVEECFDDNAEDLHIYFGQ